MGFTGVVVRWFLELGRKELEVEEAKKHAETTREHISVLKNNLEDIGNRLGAGQNIDDIAVIYQSEYGIQNTLTVLFVSQLIRDLAESADKKVRSWATDLVSTQKLDAAAVTAKEYIEKLKLGTTVYLASRADHMSTEDGRRMGKLVLSKAYLYFFRFPLVPAKNEDFSYAKARLDGLIDRYFMDPLEDAIPGLGVITTVWDVLSAFGSSVREKREMFDEKMKRELTAILNLKESFVIPLSKINFVDVDVEDEFFRTLIVGEEGETDETQRINKFETFLPQDAWKWHEMIATACVSEARLLVTGSGNANYGFTTSSTCLTKVALGRAKKAR
jgi:hypothetical protein